MSNKKKVLIINDPLQYGGSDLVAVRLQQNLNSQKFECIYCLRHDQKIGPLESQVAETGVRIIHQPDNRLGYFESYKYYLELFKKEHFDIVHCHLPFYSGIVMKAAYKCHIQKRVAHSHFSQPLILSKSKIKNFAAMLYRAVMRKIISRYATDIIGCSEEAGVYLAGRKAFEKKGVILNNGIDTALYQFDPDKRIAKRKELNIDGKTVLGHIGQMYYVKNHNYLIDVFNEFQKRNENSVLLLISDGPDRKSLESRVDKLGLSSKVKFLGFRDDTADLFMAMDCFVFPSIHEGFPLTLVEAQMSKLPCVVSDSITSTVKLNENLVFMSLKADKSSWCSSIEKLVCENREQADNIKVIENFDIKRIAERLENIYLH